MMTQQEQYARAMRKAEQNGRSLPEEQDFRGFDKKSVSCTSWNQGTTHLCQDDSDYWWVQIFDTEKMIAEIGAAFPESAIAKADRLGYLDAVKNLEIPEQYQ